MLNKKNILSQGAKGHFLCEQISVVNTKVSPGPLGAPEPFSAASCSTARGELRRKMLHSAEEKPLKAWRIEFGGSHSHNRDWLH